MRRLLIERVLLVAGAPDTGKSTQLRSMFLDPRLGGKIPSAARLHETYQLSPARNLYVRLTSPHERGESLPGFVKAIRLKTGAGRWNVASAVQVEAANSMPDITDVVRRLNSEFSPERIRVAILSPDRRERILSDLGRVMRALRRVPSCEVLCIDSTTRDGNGLLLADTFDFT